MGEYDPFGDRLVARLKRESEEVFQPRKRLVTNPVVITVALLAIILLSFWRS